MAIDRSEWLSIEWNSYRERRIAIIIDLKPHFCREKEKLRHFCRANLLLRAY